MNNLISSEVKTMSSREIATLTGKEHKNVLADIRKTLEDAGINSAEFSAFYVDQQLIQRPEFLLPKRECDLVISGYSVKYRLAIIDRWQELESQQIPKTLPEALRLAADLAERNAALENKITDDAPKVEFALAVRRMEGACKIGDFGKVIGIGRNILFSKLRQDEVLMADNMPYQKYVDTGYFVVIEQVPYIDHAGKSHPAFTTMVTGKGQVWLEKKYRNTSHNPKN